MRTIRSNSGKEPTRGRVERIGHWLRTFESSVLEYGDSIFENNRTANRQFSHYTKALKELSRFGNDGLSALASMLNHDRMDVRVTAAVHLLHLRTDDALRVLREAATAHRGVAMLAIVALKRWELGSYLDPATGKEVKLSPEASQ